MGGGRVSSTIEADLTSKYDDEHDLYDYDGGFPKVIRMYVA